ncbi:MAG: JAB domain-containing protein [Sphingomicrobium sp.]
MRVALAERVAERPLLGGVEGLLRYLRMEIGFFEFERLIAIYVDHETRLLKIVELGEGSPGHVAVNISNVVRNGMAIGAAGYILVHNHPSGNPEPSADDRRLTDRLFRVSDDLDMPLIDHFIIAQGRTWSSRRGGVLNDEPWTDCRPEGAPRAERE